MIEACNLIDQMQISQQNQDVQGDLYEYMLGHMQFAGAVARVESLLERGILPPRRAAPFSVRGGLGRGLSVLDRAFKGEL